ncbi:MAG: hypothetical protein QHJ73_12145, partial [Armatimonadota bacterium]|nr:hypothetical protein [Armatimonadota bacterium]
MKPLLFRWKLQLFFLWVSLTVGVVIYVVVAHVVTASQREPLLRDAQSLTGLLQWVSLVLPVVLLVSGMLMYRALALG